jgi:hypothetical protein
VDDLRAGVFLQECLSQQTDNVIALDKLAVAVKEEAAVKIAVKRDTDIRAMFDDRVAGIVAALRQKRVRNAVREVAIRGVVYLDKGDRNIVRLKALLQGINDRPAAPFPELITSFNGLKFARST